MLIGVDFDNTIVRYDALFHRACLDRGLIPETVAPSKSDVRDYLRSVGREEQWTEMQGVVYGSRMSEAEAMPGVLDFFRECRRAGVPVAIVSHKTRYPYIGERHDFHVAATRWLEENGFFDESGIGLPRDRVFFELTKEEKMSRIGAIGCDVFIDDLPEILTHPGFPSAVKKILFDPGSCAPQGWELERAESWPELTARLLAESGE